MKARSVERGTARMWVIAGLARSHAEEGAQWALSQLPSRHSQQEVVVMSAAWAQHAMLMSAEWVSSGDDHLQHSRFGATVCTL